MISSINPIGPSSPSGDSPDVASVAKLLEAELDNLTAALSNLKLQKVPAQLSNVAHLIVNLGSGAENALKTGRS